MIQTAQRMENLPFSGIRVMMERAQSDAEDGGGRHPHGDRPARL